jgi:tetratricopeptide (TPR) repeat protein
MINQEIRMRVFRFAAMLAATLGLAGAGNASNNPQMDVAVQHINDRWAHIRYQVTNRDEQFRQLDALAGQAAQVVARFPGRAEPLLWQGIVTSEEAARASVFRQLSLARSARDILERAQAIDPNIADGGVKMSLGVLYYRVPGFPIGFGNTAKARGLLEAALRQDPHGLDNNFFYADFLNDEGHPAQAKIFALRGLQAPVNTARPVWDAGRRAEMQALLVKINAKLKRS